jgi:hypothetical protein
MSVDVFISYRRGSPDSWVARVLSERLETVLGNDALVEPLPKLQPIEAGDIRAWLGLDEVKARASSRRDAIEDLAEKSEYCYEPGKMHMRLFADGVRKILSAV